MAAFDSFLKIDGIKGESQNDRHKDEIDVESFSWGVTAVGAHSATGGAGAGKVKFNDFHFTMRVNKASPTLFLDCANGQHIKQAVLVGEMASDVDRGASQFFKYTFTDVIVSSYQDGGVGGGDVTDSAALSYASVKAEATPGARVDIPPQATGNLMFDPATGQPTVVEGQAGVLLSGPVVNPDGILIGLLRGISEFSLGNVLGLISGPSPHMRLVLGVQEVRTLGEQPLTGTNLAAVATELVTTEISEDRPKKPKKKTPQHNIYWYAPADLVLTPDDFGRKGRRLGQLRLDPDGEALQQDFDLTEMVLEGGFNTIGIRIQSAMDHVHAEDEDDGQNDDHDERNDDETEGESAASRTAPRNPTAFMLTLEVVAD